MAKEFLSEKELSKRLGIPVGTLQAWRRAGKFLPYVKIGSRVRYDWDECLKVIQGNMFNPSEKISEDDEADLTA